MSHDRSVSVSTVIHEEVEEDEDGEQPTGHGPLLLTRVETARHEDGPTGQQEQDHEKQEDIPAEDPPPYADDSVIEHPEKPQLKEKAPTDTDVEAGEASSSNSTTNTDTKDENETNDYPSSDPPSYAEIASASGTSETPDDTAPTSAAEEESTKNSILSTEAGTTETPEQNTTKDTDVEDTEPKTETEDNDVPATKFSVEAEDEAAPKPDEVANSDAADETEATKTVAD